MKPTPGQERQRGRLPQKALPYLIHPQFRLEAVCRRCHASPVPCQSRNCCMFNKAAWTWSELTGGYRVLVKGLCWSNRFGTSAHGWLVLRQMTANLDVLNASTLRRQHSAVSRSQASRVAKSFNQHRIASIARPGRYRKPIEKDRRA